MTLLAERLNYTREELAAEWRVSSRTIDRRIAAGELDSYTEGWRRLIPAESARRYVERRMTEANGPARRRDAFGADPSP